MKPLELTPEHRTKLLEMCNVLFQNCKWHFWESDSDDYPTYNMIGYPNHVNLGTDKKIIPSLEIHWFEFCMTHLVEAIIATYVVNKDGEKVYKRTLNDSLSTFYLQTLLFSRGYDKQHPIDYLYNEFKKLNL